MMHPDAVDDRPNRQWVIPASNGTSELKAASSVTKGLPFGRRCDRQKPPRYWLAQVVGVATQIHTRFKRCGRILQAHGSGRGAWACGQPVLHGVPKLLQLCLRWPVGQKAQVTIGQHDHAGRAVRTVEYLPQ